MLTYIARRFLYSVPVLIVSTFLSFTFVSLAGDPTGNLRQNPKAAVVVPHDPGRIGRAFHRSGQILADEAKVLVYVLLVGMPFFLLGAFLFGSWRVRRRREEQRILAT